MALIFETKVALFDALKAHAPAGTQVTFAENPEGVRKRQLWLGATMDDDLQPVAMRDGPRKPTNVTGYIDVSARSVSPAGALAAERSVNELREAITSACAALDRTSVPGLMDVRPESAAVETLETTDGAHSALVVRVRVRGRVTQ